MLSIKSTNGMGGGVKPASLLVVSLVKTLNGISFSTFEWFDW